MWKMREELMNTANTKRVKDVVVRKTTGARFVLN